MKYIKQLLLSLKEIIITYILQFIIIIVSCIIYKGLGYQNLNYFINNYCSIILIIFYILTIVYLIKHNKKKESKLPLNKYYSLILLGISTSCFFNMIIFILKPPAIIASPIPLILLTISSGIIGPIYEEILFRYINLNKLKKFNSESKSIIINSIIFSLIHLNPIKIFYAFFLGLTLNISYQKTNNIKAPIIIHTSANLISLLLNQYNIYILLLSILGIYLSYEFLIKIK